MSTTTIRIEDNLKARIAAAAARAGTTAHAYIVDAIARTVEQAELDDEFHRIADARWAKLQTLGKSIPWDSAKTYLEARARGENPRKPAARKIVLREVEPSKQPAKHQSGHKPMHKAVR